MVLRNKLYRVFDKYRKFINSQSQKGRNNKLYLRGIKSKNEILDFYLTNNRWPSRLSKNTHERKLASRFENYVSKEAASYDYRFRRLAMVTGRTTNKKRKHDVQKFKKDILEFVKTHNRVPVIHKDSELIEGESLLRSRLDYYTQEKKDMSLLGEVYAIDKCHKSGIPSKFRAIINQNINLKKPLIRLVKE